MKLLMRLKLFLHGEEGAEVGGIGSEPAIDSQAEEVVVYGKAGDEPSSSVAPVETVDRTSEWQTTKEKYKDLFEQDFKQHLDRRLKGKNKEIGTMRSIVEPFMKHFGFNDISQMKAFVDDDIIPQLEDYTPTEYSDDDSEGDASTASEVIPSAADLANESLELSEKLKAQGVEFDLQTEIDNPAVSDLLKRGLTLEQAYTLAHHDEILLRETQKAAVAQKAATIEAIRTKGIEAVQEVASKPAPKVVHKTDPSQFTANDLDEIAKRVLRGEKIRF